jgi:hypothetical protein
MFNYLINQISKHKIFNQIILMLKVLRYLDINNNTSVAILSKNSKGWIVTFWTALIGNMPIVVIHPNESKSRIIDILNKKAVSVLFIDDELYFDKSYNRSEFTDKLFFTTLIFSIPHVTSLSFKMQLLHANANKLLKNNGEDWYTLFNKLETLAKLSNLGSDLRKFEMDLMVENFISKAEENAHETVLKLNNGIRVDYDSVVVKSFSPGVTESYSYKNGIELTLDELRRISSRFSDFYPFPTFDKITSFVEFSLWYPFLVVNSVLSNKEIVYPNKKDEKKLYVYDTVTFEKMWREEFEYILQIPFYRNLYLFIPFFYRRFIKKKFYKVFGKNVSEVTVLNCQVRKNILNHLVKCKLPITFTYGETGSGFITTKYKTLFIPGRMYKGRLARNERLDENDIDSIVINLEQLENIIKSIPFVLNCLVLKNT